MDILSGEVFAVAAFPPTECEQCEPSEGDPPLVVAGPAAFTRFGNSVSAHMTVSDFVQLLGIAILSTELQIETMSADEQLAAEGLTQVHHMAKKVDRWHEALTALGLRVEREDHE